MLVAAPNHGSAGLQGIPGATVAREQGAGMGASDRGVDAGAGGGRETRTEASGSKPAEGAAREFDCGWE